MDIVSAYPTILTNAAYGKTAYPGTALTNLVSDAPARVLSSTVLRAVESVALDVMTMPYYDPDDIEILEFLVGHVKRPTRRYVRVHSLVELAARAAVWAEHIDGAWKIP